MSNAKALTALGFAQRTGKCASGETGCDAEFKAGRALMIIIDAEASNNTRLRWQSRCENAGIPFAVLQGAGEAVGKPGKRVLAVMDTGFSRMIQSALASGEE